MNKIKVSDLKMNGYSAIQSFKDPVYARNILNYIDFLATNNSINSDEFELPIEETCEDLVIKTNVTIDKQKVNEMFFSFLETQKEIEKNNYKTPPQDVISSLNKRDIVAKERRIHQIMDDISYNIDKIAELNRRMNDHFSICRKNNLEIDMLNNRPIRDYGVDVEKAIKETNWDYLLYNENEGSIVFKNRCDVILRYVDREYGIDYSINCGKYAVKVFIRDFKITLHKTQSTVVCGVAIHPHVNNDAHAPCWGNAAVTIQKAIQAGDIVTILKVLDSLLSNYNPDSPYVQIHKYKLAADANELRKVKMHEEKFKASFHDEEAEEDIEEEDDEDEFEEDDSDEEGDSDDY